MTPAEIVTQKDCRTKGGTGIVKVRSSRESGGRDNPTRRRNQLVKL